MPTLSIVIPSKSHDDAVLQRLLCTLRKQTFQDFEVLVETEGNSEEAKGKAALSATGEIVAFFCTDNDLRDPDFLRTMVWYARLPDCTGAYTAQYDYVPYDTSLNRYFALIGANDPICWWLRKADRRDYIRRDHCISQVVTFKQSIPSLGDNGFFIKRSILLKASFTPQTFGSCMCVCEDLRRLGYAIYWIVATHKVWHRTGEDFLDYLNRRWRYVNELYWVHHHTRRWIMVATYRDWRLVLLFALASLLVVPQVLLSLFGYRSVNDRAWFWHPVICLSLTFLYTWAFLRHWSLKLLHGLKTILKSEID